MKSKLSFEIWFLLLPLLLLLPQFYSLHGKLRVAKPRYKIKCEEAPMSEAVSASDSIFTGKVIALFKHGNTEEHGHRSQVKVKRVIKGRKDIAGQTVLLAGLAVPKFCPIFLRKF